MQEHCELLLGFHDPIICIIVLIAVLKNVQLLMKKGNDLLKELSVKEKLNYYLLKDLRIEEIICYYLVNNPNKF